MKKTSFQPQQNGFAFINAWTLEHGEEAEMKQSLAKSTDRATATLAPRMAAFSGTFLPLVRQWVASAMPQSFGLCGGMAAAALDYYSRGRPTPRGKGVNDLPTSATPEGAALRRYLFNRQIESMQQNFPKLIGWMIMQHVDLPFVSGDGPAWLLEQSKLEWTALKAHIDAGTPWPITIIGTSTSPFNNHQILSYGYEDAGDGTGTIFVYDMNCPDKENSLRLDFHGAVLQAQETCADERRGPLRGFFCNDYRPAEPPDVTY
jgi:hypothetical protein